VIAYGLSDVPTATLQHTHKNIELDARKEAATPDDGVLSAGRGVANGTTALWPTVPRVLQKGSPPRPADGGHNPAGTRLDVRTERRPIRSMASDDPPRYGTSTCAFQL